MSEGRPFEQQAAAKRTDTQAYTDRLTSLSDAGWKQRLNVQAPYRWNLQRLHLGRVLDVGCGIGRNLINLDGNGVGVDHNAASIEEARQRGLTAWTTEEWPSCPDAVPGSFDTILVAHVLEHVTFEEGDALLKEYLPFLKPGGRIVLICPQEKGYTTDATHIRFVSEPDLERHVESIGFTVSRMYSFPFLRAAGRVFPYNEFVCVAVPSASV